jgi:RNA polymerase sigma-70 factor (ECF subfamily)
MGTPVAHFGETELGGSQREFPKTIWGMVVRMKDESTESRRAALEDLARRYWKPVYHFIRMAWSKSNEDAKDLTQAFFAWLTEGDTMRKYEPSKGSFRTYLRILLKHFLQHQDEAMRRFKRGGGVKLAPLAGDPDYPQVDIPDPKATDPEKAYDETWMVTLAQNALQRVRERCRAGGREKEFRAYEEYDLKAARERPTYAAVAATLGVKESDVRNYLFRIREEIWAEIRVELALVTRDKQELEEEWNALFGSR